MAAAARKKFGPLADTLSRPTKVAAEGLYPQGSGSGGDVTHSDGTITTRRRTAVENARIAEFDRSMGFSEPAARNNFATAAASDRAARLKKDAYDIGPYAEDTTGTFASQRAPEIVGGRNGAPAYQRDAQGVTSVVPKAVAVAPVAPVTAPPDALPGTLSQAGSRLAGPLAQARPPATTTLPVSLPPATSSVPVPSAAPTPGPTTTPAPTATPAPAAIAEATPPAAIPGPTPTSGTAGTAVSTSVADPYANAGPGRSTAAGVSNSQAAGFTQPTADKPVPETPTSPVMNIDDYDKKKTAFAGF